MEKERALEELIKIRASLSIKDLLSINKVKIKNCAIITDTKSYINDIKSHNELCLYTGYNHLVID